MALPNKYAQAVWDAEGVLATWLPDRQLRVGDVVSRSRDGAGLQVETNIADLVHGEQPGPTTHRAGASRLVLQDGVSFEASAVASAPGAGARACFAGASSFLFVADQGTVTEYRRLADMRAVLTSLHDRAVWSDGWYLVTAVRSFAAMTLVVAESAGTEVSVQGNSSHLVSLDLIRAGAGVTVASGRAATWTMGPSTPLYEALFIRRRLLRGDEVRTGYLDSPSSGSPEGDGAAEVARVTPIQVGLLDA